MKHNALTRRIAASPLAPLAGFPLRLANVVQHNARIARLSASWLVRSREHVHYTYDLEPLNMEHLAWFVATATGTRVATVRGYLKELQEDAELRRVMAEGLARSSRSASTDKVVRYGRRIGWYAFVRALRPEFVVETGTNRGLGSAVIAAALLRNGRGRLATADIDDRSGELILPPYDKVVEHVVGDSLEFLAGPVARQQPIDLFFVDTGHTPEHERAELLAGAPLLAPHAVVVATKTYCWPELSRWAEEQQREFLHFSEKPLDHWYRGVGIGASFPSLVRA
ncbi:class I SAM-dependent methyltransferase [Streptomyces camelliae]|uniref:Class I SAM-dependent methyltransferase n=1 Tax=Streptomyces camelliae TaxID=3004093 RepID=A0ABY7P2Z5_9ACTN|nr:class I SAM-dependent methyltransferase [Streptomyces sp. HUAS 2-6]WBO64906.1 class I SAM-dependent methyltransferase [Streptomyces sp. HUAS 2-6]